MGGAPAVGALEVQRLAIVAHELRRPLLPIGVAAALLSRSADDPVKLARLQRTIELQVGLLSRVIADLTETTQAATGNLAVERRPMVTTAFVERAVDACRPMLDARRQSLRMRLPNGPFELQADAERLTQVLINLLGNASKFSGDGTPIDLCMRVRDDAVLLSVSDRGIGIEPDEQVSMFKLFSQGARAKRFRNGGLGIGLWVVRQIVLAHAGQVTATSAGRGRGTRFAVTLPIATHGGT
ncbi:MAG TPA: HAMP domain-containing sensor histidine kinase [Zeimonas sp.]